MSSPQKLRLSEPPAIAAVLLCVSVALSSCSREATEPPGRPIDSPGKQQRTVAQKVSDVLPFAGKPDIELDVDSYDFGTVSQLKLYDHVLKVRNVGTAKLVIKRAAATCTCYEVSLSEMELEPGDETDLKVTLKSGMMEGTVTKGIMVASNDPDEPLTTIQITANIVPRLIVHPRMIRIKDIHKSEGATAWLTVRPAEHVEITSIEAKSTSQHILPTIEPADDESGKYTVKVTIASAGITGGVGGAIEFFINGETEPAFRVQVGATVVKDIDVSPTQLVFTASRGDESAIGAIILEKAAGGTFEVLDVDSNVPALVMEVSTLEKGNSYAVIARLAPNAETARVRGRITIHTDDPDQAEIVVPVFGTIQ